MARPRMNLNGRASAYLPIGTIALPEELVARMRIMAQERGGMAALVRAALIKMYVTDLPESSIPAVQEPFSLEEF